MASEDKNTSEQSNEKPSKSIKLCTFCNNSTNGFDKWLHVTEQDRSPFFPILAEIRGEETAFDDSGKALVCVACFHHLLRQWSSYERRCIPLQKRQYNLVAEEKLSNFQIKREEEIRKEGELKLKEIKLREEKIKREARERLEQFRQKEQSIKEEAERRLLQEEEELEIIKREADRRLKEEQAREEELKRLLEEEIQLERQKGDYIRKEAERLLREEKLLRSSQPPASVRTEVLIRSPQGRAFDQINFENHSDENLDNGTDDKVDGIMEPRTSRTMEYDPVTGCYVRKVPLDFKEKKVEDIVKAELMKSEKKGKSSWRKTQEKEKGSTPDTALVDLSLPSSDGDTSLPHYASGGVIETEYQFTVKEESKTESKPAGFDKNGELADDDNKKAGEAMKAKFQGDRMRFEGDSDDVVMSESTKRSSERQPHDEDPDSKKSRGDPRERTQSLDKRLREIEERRTRLLKDSPEDKTDTNEAKITRTITTNSTYTAPSSDGSILDNRMQEAHRRHRNREERIRRRKNAEEILSKRNEGEENPKSAPLKSTGVKLELRGSAIKKSEDTSSKVDSELHAFSGSSYSYRHDDDISDITFTVKKPAEANKDDDDYIEKFDKKESSDWNESQRISTVRTTETKTTSTSLMNEPIDWSQPGRGGDDNFSFSVKEPSRKLDSDKISGEKEKERESTRSQIKESEVTVVESKPVQSLFSSDFGQEEPQEILFSVKETSTSTKRSTGSDSPKSKPKELTLERGSFDEKYSVKSTSNVDLMQWETDNVDSGKPSEPEPFDSMDNYRDSLRRTNALGRVGSFKKGREELPPAIFHDIESDAPGASLVDIRTDFPSPVASLSRDSAMEADQAPNLLSKYQEEDSDSEERLRRRQEIEEKKRRIAESQKKANVQLRRDVSEKTKSGASDSGSPDEIEDLSEKRRSLLMMWESYAEGEGPGPENRKPEEGRSQFGYDAMMTEAAQFDPNAASADYRTMDVEDEKEDIRVPVVDIDENHKLNDDELKWERAGQFEPGKLKTKFHEMGPDESSEPKTTRRGMNNNDITTKVTYEEQRFSYQAPVEDQSYTDETAVVESAPKQLWDESQGQSTYKNDDEDEEELSWRPHVDVDEVHRMTEEEAHWEKVGHFQPGKINTSIFESRKKADKNGVESPKIQRREKSRYEQIKKIQRTDSKKELLVPKKVSLKSDRKDDLEEEDEHERPYVGKIDTPSFHETSEDERRRKEREERNRREMEEIQREREEERRRQERENLESKTSINDFEDDEYDAKVKSRDVGKIDIAKFGEFQKKSEPIPEKKQVSKLSTKRTVETRREESVPRTYLYSREDEGYDIQVRDTSVGKLNMDSSPFMQRDSSLKETSPPRKVQERALSKKDVIVVQESPLVMATSPTKTGEDEFDNMTRARSVKKLDVSRLPFTQSQDNHVDNKPLKHDKKDKLPDKTPVDDRKRERERETREWEEQLKRERDEIEQTKRAHEKAFQDNNKGGNEIDTNDYETETRNIRKLDLSMFSKFQQDDAAREKPERKTSDKTSKRAYTQEKEVVVVKTVNQVESALDFQYEEDEYEIKRRSVGKLNKDWLSQAQEQEAREIERRRKEAEIERIRREQYEMEQLKLEEIRRRELEGDGTYQDEAASSDKPQNVKKLDSTFMTPFLKGGHPSLEGTEGLSKKKNKDEVRQERKLARKESRSKMQTQEEVYAQQTEDVQQSPESFDDHPKVVGKLNTEKYLQMMGEDHSDKERRKKFVEEERMRRELEEMERQKEEEERRKEMDRDDSSSSSSSDRPQNVNKLDLTQFSQFQKQDTVVMRKKQSPKEKAPESRKNEIIERQVTDEVESEPLVPETTEREWLERERSEAQLYEEKRQNVGRLDVSRLMQSRSEEEQERQSRIRELERQRILKEKEEMERLKAEKKKGKKGIDEESETSEASREDHAAPARRPESQHDREREQEWTVEEKRKSGVGRLNVDQFIQSMSKEEEDKNRRKLELEKERIRKEAEERERLRMEQQMASDVIKVSTVQEVHSAPDEDFYRRTSREEREREEEMSVEEKRKSVGRLDVNKFVQSLSDEAEEKRRRKIELEKERIRRENEEKELLRREQEGKLKTKEQEPSATKSGDSRKNIIVYRDSNEPRDERREVETRDKEKYTIIDKEREEEMSVEEKRKSVGRLDVAKYMQSLSQEEEEKRRRRIELERERIRREEEEKEMLRLEQERAKGEQVSRTVVQEVETSPYDLPDEGRHPPSRIDKEREEELSVEEKRKSVGRLNVSQYFQSLGEEDQEKKRRKIELEKERIRRENEERELLRREQERSRSDQVEQVDASVVEEVHSAPPDDILTDNDKRSSLEREREEAMSVEEKRKSVGRLDFNQFIQSLTEEDREKQMRKIELERERMRREQEEREQEEKQYRQRETSSYSEQIQTSNVEVVQSEAPLEYEDGDSSEDRKGVGRLDLERYSQQFTQEARERERRARELEIERLRLEREEMEGRGGGQTVEHESRISERRETTIIDEKRKFRDDEVDRRSEGRTESTKSEESSDSDKPVPKKLDLSKFSAFQSGSGKRTTRDDSAVKRRDKSEGGRQARPKSYAGSTFGGVANGEARSGDRVYRIIH